MDSFYLIVIVVATLALILLLTYVGLLMTYYKDKDTTYPPVAASCPDKWEVSKTKENVCVVPSAPTRGKERDTTHPNIGNIYSWRNNYITLNSRNTKGFSTLDGKAVIDFSHPSWGRVGNTVCAKQAWAKSRGLIWDGITNYNSC